MKINLKLFSILRDCLPAEAQQGQATIELPEEATLSNLVTHLEIDQRLGDPKVGIDLEMLGTVHERQGEYMAALEKYEQAKLIYQKAIPTSLPIIEAHIVRVRGKLAG